MAKASILVFLVLTVVIALALRRREAERLRAGGFVARKRAAIRLWFDAAALAVGATLVTLAAMHWLRLGTWW
ncbi:hypothetical protein KO353_04740 [Elioraea tepida]|uniref:Uncharacterized protein n=1 Tax=Elioraea tepida TaxID=2843330 RepID=A0A975U377_9PROT|nr:hypothetical protein [Elioraea tepida]QXM25532.1 hypothetical protein KO353_04740 [Elioraea tepida]